MCFKKCTYAQTNLMLSIYLLFVLELWHPSTVLSTSIVTCNCTRLEECAALKFLLLNQKRHEGTAAVALTRGVACSVDLDSDKTRVCCANVESKRRKSRRQKRLAFANHEGRVIRSVPTRRISSEYPWVWDSRPFIPITEENQEDDVPVENRFASIREGHKLSNPFQFAPNLLDFKDAKSLRNCPQPFYEEGNERLKDPYHHFHQYHIAHGSSSEEDIYDTPIVYPDDKRFDRPILFPRPYAPPSVQPMLTFSARPKIPKSQPPTPSEVLTKEASAVDQSSFSSSINSPQCGVSVGTRIFGGMPSSPSQFPWVTRIAYLNKTSNRISYRCSGSVISDVYVLTAAHCVINLVKDLQLSHVRIGDAAIPVDCQDKGGECNTPNTYRISEIIVNPNYDQPKYANDIALLKILRPPGNHATICLPRDNSANLVDRLIGSSGVVAGWSTNKEGVETPANATVKFLRLPIVNNTECAITYAKYSENFNDPIVITPSQLCAQGEPMNDVCRGDSGGPFMDDGTSGLISSNGRYTLLGIVAFGPTMCGVSNFPGVYMRVSSYVPWIADNIS